MTRKLSSRFIKQFLALCLGSSCLFLTIKLQSAQIERISEKTLTKDIYLKQDKSKNIQLSFLKKMPAFGFDNLIADWSMLEFMQYFGDGEARKETGYSLSADYLEVITNKDPRFSTAYMIISPASSVFGGTPKRTLELMDRGLKHLTPDMPYAYFVWLYKGTDEILFFGDLKNARKSYEKAAEWATIAKDKKIAQSASKTVKFLATNPDTTQAQVGIWFQVWVNSKEKMTREAAQENIEKLGGELKVYPDGRVEAIPPKTSKS